MLISRTHRTWNQDYYRITDGIDMRDEIIRSTSSSTSTSSESEGNTSSSSSSTSLSSSSSSSSTSESSSSSSSTSESSSSSSSSTSLSSESSGGMRAYYCYAGPETAARGTYTTTGGEQYDYPVYSNGTYYLTLKSINGTIRWVIDIIIGSLPDQYTDKQLLPIIGEMIIEDGFVIEGTNPLLPDENNWEFGTLIDGICPSSSSSTSESSSSSSTSESSSSSSSSEGGFETYGVVDNGIPVIDNGVQVLNT